MICATCPITLVGCRAFKILESHENSMPDLNYYVVFCSAVMDVRVNEYLFCFDRQFQTWYKQLVGEVEDNLREEDKVEVKKEQSHKTSVLEKRPINCTIWGPRGSNRMITS